MAPGQDQEPVPSIFDEDPDTAGQKRSYGLRRVRSALITSGVLIVLPWLIAHLQRPGFGSISTLSAAATALIVLGGYIALGAYAMRKPFTALIIGIAAYVALQVLVVAMALARHHPEAFTAWMFRLLVVLNLLMPLPRARKLQRWR